MDKTIDENTRITMTEWDNMVGPIAIGTGYARSLLDKEAGYKIEIRNLSYTNKRLFDIKFKLEHEIDALKKKHLSVRAYLYCTWAISIAVFIYLFA